MTTIPRCPECNCELTPSDRTIPPNMWQCWNGCGRAWSPAERDTSPPEDVYCFIYRYASREDQPDAPDEEYCAWVVSDAVPENRRVQTEAERIAARKSKLDHLLSVRGVEATGDED
jgi:hypothetical protein